MIIKEIPAKLNNKNDKKLNGTYKKRVCGYARVSTDLHCQENSFKFQLDYYKQYISENRDWEFVKLYADKGVTGTMLAPRIGFNEMIADAKKGKIDMIITKSISRFARNTVDSIKIIRELRGIGVDVYFERENYHILDENSELLLSIISGISQEESHSISENTKWGFKKKYLDGSGVYTFKKMLGYKKDEQGNLIVNKKEAKIVKMIFDLFINGYSIASIAKKLTLLGYKNVKGECRWSSNSIIKILTNEKYKGDSVFQKYYSKDFISKKTMKNNGEFAKYQVIQDHDYIIERDIFDVVQFDLKKRDCDRQNSQKHIISSRLFCGECKSPFGRKTWIFNGKKVIAYSCNDKNISECKIHYVLEEDLKLKIISGLNRIFNIKELIIKKDMKKLKKNNNIEESFTEKNVLENEINDLKNKINLLVEEIDNCNNIDFEDGNDSVGYFNKKRNEYEELKKIFDIKNKELNKLINYIMTIKSKMLKIKIFVENIKHFNNEIEVFDEDLHIKLIDRIYVYNDRIDIIFKDESIISV